MPKFKKTIDGNEVEIDVSEEELIDIAKSQKGFLEKIREVLGLDKKDNSKQDIVVKDKDKDKKEEEKVENEALKELRAELEAYKKTAAEKEAAEVARKAELRGRKVTRLLDEAVKEGKIAKGEKEALSKKYSDSPALLTDYLALRPSDPALKRGNNETLDSEGKPSTGGAKVFSEREIQNMSEKEFEKHEADILSAMSKGNIID